MHRDAEREIERTDPLRNSVRVEVRGEGNSSWGFPREKGGYAARPAEDSWEYRGTHRERPEKGAKSRTLETKGGNNVTNMAPKRN